VAISAVGPGNPAFLACQQASEWAGVHQHDGRIFGGTWDQRVKALTWREYASDAELEKVAGRTVFTVARA
jgi:hypothetical protein